MMRDVCVSALVIVCVVPQHLLLCRVPCAHFCPCGVCRPQKGGPGYREHHMCSGMFFMTVSFFQEAALDARVVFCNS